LALIIEGLGFVPLSEAGAGLLFDLIGQQYERGGTIVTSNLPFDEWTFANGSQTIGVPLAHPPEGAASQARSSTASSITSTFSR